MLREKERVTAGDLIELARAALQERYQEKFIAVSEPRMDACTGIGYTVCFTPEQSPDTVFRVRIGIDGEKLLYDNYVSQHIMRRMEHDIMKLLRDIEANSLVRVEPLAEIAEATVSKEIGEALSRQTKNQFYLYVFFSRDEHLDRSAFCDGVRKIARGTQDLPMGKLRGKIVIARLNEKEMSEMQDYLQGAEHLGAEFEEMMQGKRFGIIPFSGGMTEDVEKVSEEICDGV